MMNERGRCKSMKNEKVWLEIADVARLVGLTPTTIRHHIRAGRLTPAATTPRGARLFRMAEVRAFQQARKATQK